MFDYFINNKTEKLVFLQKKPFTIFKIENFLSDSEYNYIDKISQNLIKIFSINRSTLETDLRIILRYISKNIKRRIS